MLSYVREVAIADCVHYCAFKYGCAALNPYEAYISGLADGESLLTVRERFTDFVRYYRPRDLGEALGVRTSRSVPLWWLPWKSWRKLLRPQGWRNSPNDVGDIMTCFSEKGIRQSSLEKEYGWLEGAWRNISTVGYMPERYSYITVFALVAQHRERFLVLDGNHRLSALSKLGYSHVLVRQGMFSKAFRKMARYWPLVLSSHVTMSDALIIFDAYFAGHSNPVRADYPATILSDC